MRKKERRREREEGKRERKKKGKGERRRESIDSSSDLRHSDDRSSSGRELKSVYSMRVTLKEVEILPTLVYFHLRAILPCFFSLKGYLAGFFL